MFAPGVYNEKQRRDDAVESGEQHKDVDVEIIDEIAADELAAYRLKTTKWIAATLECIQDPLFWFTVSASYKARAPIRHLFNILSKYSHATNRCEAGAMSIHTSQLPIVNLVTKRLDQLQNEFKELLNSTTTWSTEIIEDLSWIVEFSGKELNIDHMNAISTQLVLHNLAAFRRRVVNVLTKCFGCINTHPKYFVESVLNGFLDGGHFLLGLSFGYVVVAMVLGYVAFRVGYIKGL